MKISAKVNLVNKDYVVGIASILIESCFLIHDIRIVQKKDSGYLVAMPSKRKKDGEYQDIAHPINAETRKFIEEKVMNNFYAEINNKLESLAEKLGSEYHFKYKFDDVHSIALFKEDKLIDEYTLDNYSSEQLEELEKEIKEKIGK